MKYVFLGSVVLYTGCWPGKEFISINPPVLRWTWGIRLRPQDVTCLGPICPLCQWGSLTRQSVTGSKSRNWWCSSWPSVLRERSQDGKCSRSWWLLLSCSVMSDSLRPQGLQHARLPCPSQSPGVCSNSCPLSWRCHPTISSSVTPFSTCLQSSPVSQLFASGGQSTGASASASVLHWIFRADFL